MDLNFILTALLIGALCYLPILGLYKFLMLYAKYRQLEIIQRVLDENVIIRIETVKHKEQEVQLVFNHRTGKFVTQHTSQRELVADLIERFKGKTVHVVQVGGGTITLFDKEETV
jgi:hypothetical protein